MKYIKYTMVDKRTRVPIWDEPAKNGPDQPDVKGLELKFADKSNWPISTGSPRYPIYFGTCPDDSDTAKPGVIQELTETEYNEAYENELNRRKRQARKKVNRERDNKIGQGMSYTFPDGSEGTIQLRDLKDKTNVQGLGSNGLKLKVDGDTSTTVPFRDKENQLHNLNSDELIEMGEQVSSFMQNHYDSSWNIKADIEAAATFDELNSINITNNDKWSS